MARRALFGRENLVLNPLPQVFFQRAELLRFIALFADDGISALKAQRRLAFRRDKRERQPVVGHADVRLRAERQRAAERWRRCP